tara:strand:+ start:11309 stop:11749 length:441 start_codon:yes stop_codon:yes gene_type:complete
MDKRKFNGGARKGAGRKRGIGITYDIQKYCQDFVEEILKNEAIKQKAVEQLVIKYKDIQEYIYILKGENSYKIGYTTNFNKRIKNYKTHNPNIKTLCVIESSNSFELESYLHNRFENKNIDGEWFDLTEEEVLLAMEYLYSTTNGW